MHHHLQTQLIATVITIAVVSFLHATSRPIFEKIIRRLVAAERYETKLDERKREDTLINVFHALFAVVLWIAALFVILAIFRVQIAPLVTGAGLFGVIFGLGAQNVIKDYFAGIYILTENQYRVGDIVTLAGGSMSAGGISGVVEEITLRITKLRDLDGTLSVVRNGEPSIITNRTFHFSSVVLDLTIDDESDIATAEKIINEVGAGMMDDETWAKRIIEPIQFLRVDDFNDRGTQIKALGKVQPAAQWDVAGEFRKRLKPEFDKHDIQFALLGRYGLDHSNPDRPKRPKKS